MSSTHQSHNHYDLQSLGLLFREENSRLEKEHRALLAGATRGDSTVSLQSSEEKALRQQRARLEARMAILEDHNRQLEAQVFNKVSLK